MVLTLLYSRIVCVILAPAYAVSFIGWHVEGSTVSLRRRRISSCFIRMFAVWLVDVVGSGHIFIIPLVSLVFGG